MKDNQQTYFKRPSKQYIGDEIPLREANEVPREKSPGLPTTSYLPSSPPHIASSPALAPPGACRARGRVQLIIFKYTLIFIELHHTAHSRALIFGERYRFSPLVPKAIKS